MKWLLIVCVLTFFNQSVYSARDSYNEPIRRITVFPFASSQSDNNSAIEAWWKTREVLANGKLFLVASKDFLQRKDVFQPRIELSPSDVIILSELLDAQLVMTGSLMDKEFKLTVYESKRGQIVWTSIKKLHPSIPVKDQIEKTSMELTQEFIESVPYHGFIYKDPIIGQVLYQKEGSQLVQINYSTEIKVDIEDVVHFFWMNDQNNRPLFMGGSITEIFAEGKIREAKSGWAVVEIERITNLSHINENTLIRFPNEMKRIKELHSLRDTVKRKIQPDYFSSDLQELKTIEGERRPLATALTFLINAAAFLLLAF